uniref:Uncharacterized protein n=1 Tax=viral metagenome TaxID=1070528 RepID=A0A6C0BML9_9ZZZZ
MQKNRLLILLLAILGAVALGLVLYFALRPRQDDYDDDDSELPTSAASTIISSSFVVNFLKLFGTGTAVTTLSYAWKFLQFLNIFGIFSGKKQDLVTSTANEIEDTLTNYIAQSRIDQFSNVMAATILGTQTALQRACRIQAIACDQDTGCSGDFTCQDGVCIANQCKKDTDCGTTAARCVGGTCEIQTCPPDCDCGDSSRCHCISGVCTEQRCCQLTEGLIKDLGAQYEQYTEAYKEGIYTLLQTFQSMLKTRDSNHTNFKYRSRWNNGDLLQLGSVWEPSEDEFQYYNRDLNATLPLDLQMPLTFGVLNDKTYTGSTLSASQLSQQYVNLINITQLLIQYTLIMSQVGMLLKKNSVNWFVCLCTSFVAYMLDVLQYTLMHYTSLHKVVTHVGGPFWMGPAAVDVTTYEVRDYFPSWSGTPRTLDIFTTEDEVMDEDYWVKPVENTSHLQTCYVYNNCSCDILVQTPHTNLVRSTDKNIRPPFVLGSGKTARVRFPLDTCTITIGGYCDNHRTTTPIITAKNGKLYTLTGKYDQSNPFASCKDTLSVATNTASDQHWDFTVEPYANMPPYNFTKVINASSYLRVFIQQDMAGDQTSIHQSLTDIVNTMLSIAQDTQLSSVGADECKPIECPEGQINYNDVCYSSCPCDDDNLECVNGLCVPKCEPPAHFNVDFGGCQIDCGGRGHKDADGNCVCQRNDFVKLVGDKCECPPGYIMHEWADDYLCYLPCDKEGATKMIDGETHWCSRAGEPVPGYKVWIPCIESRCRFCEEGIRVCDGCEWGECS